MSDTSTGAHATATDVPSHRQAYEDLARTAEDACNRIYAMLGLVEPAEARSDAGLREIAEDLDTAGFTVILARLNVGQVAKGRPDAQENRAKPSRGHLRLV
jgi:hypothetical protein